MISAQEAELQAQHENRVRALAGRARQERLHLEAKIGRAESELQAEHDAQLEELTQKMIRRTDQVRPSVCGPRARQGFVNEGRLSDRRATRTTSRR